MSQPGGLPELSSSFEVIINEELGLTLDTDIAELLQCTSGTVEDRSGMMSDNATILGTCY